LLPKAVRAETRELDSNEYNVRACTGSRGMVQERSEEESGTTAEKFGRQPRQGRRQFQRWGHVEEPNQQTLAWE